jgi:hypothetical protein
LIELEQPTRLMGLARVGRGAIDRIAGQTGQLRAIGNAAGKGARRIEHILGKLGCQVRQALRNFTVAGFLIGP